ncbi:MAG: aminotransferase class I/II-fold pyridoxal phosphate-dependent enzyme [Bacteroidota bacterium]
MSRTPYREHSAPLFVTSSFVYDDAEHAESMFAGEGEGDIYSRFTNPNTTELIERMNALERTEAGVATASGMAAVFSTLATHLDAGDHLVACSSLFGNSLYIIEQILPKWGIRYTLVDIHDHDHWEKAIAKKPKMVLIETPSNPGLDLIDLEWMGELCMRSGVMFCVDNCFATPILQKPIDYGADLIIHSATKWIDGQGRVLGGLVQGTKTYVQPIFDFLRRTGACLSPFNAWILSKSLETLEVRMERHCSNALQLASFLESQSEVRKVVYPFLESHPQHDLAHRQMTMGGGIITIHFTNVKQVAFEFINRLRLPSLTANLGDSRTIITHPATTTHSKLSEEQRSQIGIHDGTIRISVGLEHIDDIIADFGQALSSPR